MSTPTDKKITIDDFIIRNVKGLARAEATGLGDTCVIVLAGLNGAGKSTVTETLMSFFPGGGVPPLRKGADSGFARFTFSNGMTAERTIPGGIRVTHKDGAVYPRGKEMLAEFLGALGGVSIDPQKIVTMQPRDRRALTCRVVGADTEELDTRKRDKLDALKDAKRTCDAIQMENAGITEYPGAPAAEISVTELSAKLNAAIEHNAAIQRGEDITEGYRRDRTQITNEIARLESQIKDLKVRLGAVDKDIQSREQKAKAPEAQPLDTAELQAQIQGAEEINAKVRANQAKASARKRWQEAEDARLALEQDLSSIETERRNLLAKAKFPVEGMGFEGDDISLGGIPWGDLSDGEQARMASAIRIACTDGEAAFGFIDGQDLDKVRREELYKSAAAQGLQLIVEISDPDIKEGDRVLVIEDGELK